MNYPMAIQKAVFLLLIIGSMNHLVFGQDYQAGLDDLPLAKKSYTEGLPNDWLIEAPDEKAQIFTNENKNELILSNGIISRTFRLTPNAATTSLKILSDQQELVRAIKPEAILAVNGFTISVGGLTGQANLAFLYPDWIDTLKADPLSFKLSGFKVGEPEKRLEWNRVRHHAPDVHWPPKGIKLQMDYQLV